MPPMRNIYISHLYVIILINGEEVMNLRGSGKGSGKVEQLEAG